jgi:ABC-type lipoprotein release transport system permease subunit
VYGLVAFMVAQRGREMGIRAALGAGRARLVGVVLLDGLRVSAVGLVVGSVLGRALGRMLRSQLYGLSYADPQTYGMVALGLAVLAAIASLHPAVRASGADPVRVLQTE